MDLLFLLLVVVVTAVPVGIISYDKGWQAGVSATVQAYEGTDED